MRELTSDTNPRLKETGITVLDVYQAYADQGYEPSEIAYAYKIELSDVHYALAYYYAHTEKLKQLRYDEFTVQQALSESGREL
jgi:uncharacterized protein (DUF433 family)